MKIVFEARGEHKARAFVEAVRAYDYGEKLAITFSGRELDSISSESTWHDKK